MIGIHHLGREVRQIVISYLLLGLEPKATGHWKRQQLSNDKRVLVVVLVSTLMVGDNPETWTWGNSLASRGVESFGLLGGCLLGYGWRRGYCWPSWQHSNSLAFIIGFG